MNSGNENCTELCVSCTTDGRNELSSAAEMTQQ